LGGKINFIQKGNLIKEAIESNQPTDATQVKRGGSVAKGGRTDVLGHKASLDYTEHSQGTFTWEKVGKTLRDFWQG